MDPISRQELLKNNKHWLFPRGEERFRDQFQFGFSATSLQRGHYHGN